jgi:hypothetical protein
LHLEGSFVFLLCIETSQLDQNHLVLSRKAARLAGFQIGSSVEKEWEKAGGKGISE